MYHAVARTAPAYVLCLCWAGPRKRSVVRGRQREACMCTDRVCSPKAVCRRDQCAALERDGQFAARDGQDPAAPGGAQPRRPAHCQQPAGSQWRAVLRPPCRLGGEQWVRKMPTIEFVWNFGGFRIFRISKTLKTLKSRCLLTASSQPTHRPPTRTAAGALAMRALRAQARLLFPGRESAHNGRRLMVRHLVPKCWT